MALTITIPGAVEATIGATAPAILTVGVGVPGATGATGATGAQGPQGDPGAGVAAGGSTGQVLQKLSATSYDTGWLTLPADYITSVTAPLDVTTGNLTVDLSTYRELTDYDFTNVADTKLTTFGLTLEPFVGDIGIFDSNLSVTSLNLGVDHSEGGTLDGVQSSGGFGSTVVSIRARTWTSGTADAGNKVLVSTTGVQFGTYAGSTSGFTRYGNTSITFSDASVQTIAFPGFNNVALTGNPTAPTPATSDNDTSIATTAYVKAQNFGDRYLTTSTTSNTVSNGNKTFTIGTGLSYTPTQNITISYDASNHMHGEVLTYSTSTGVLTVDINHHTGSGTYAAWVVNVGGVTPATSVAWGAITGTLSAQTDLQSALDLKANLASPTFSGSPSLPTGTTAVTQTAGNNTTALATTAFVTASNPDASTTVKGHVELATNAEALAGTSDTLAMTPSAVQFARLATTFFRMSSMTVANATSGVGAAASLLASGFNSRSPTTAVGYGIYNFNLAYHSRGSGSNAITPLPWNKRFVTTFRFHPRTLGTDTNTINRVVFGKTPTPGELTVRGVGVRQIASGALELIVHNGTTFTAVTSSYTPPVLSSTDLRIVSDGAGNVTLFNNDTQIATTSAGPSTAGSTNNPYLSIESENLATITGTNNTLYVAEISFEFAQ